MKILPTTSVENLAVRPVATATLRTLPTRPNTGIVPPWLIHGTDGHAVAGLMALENTGIVPPWMLDGSRSMVPTSKG